MLTKDFTNINIAALHNSSKVKKAVQVMKKHSLNAVTAIINGNLGLFRKEQLKTVDPDTTLEDIEHLFINISVSENAHIWETISTFNTYETNALPITNENNEYIGIAILKTVFNRIFEIFPIGNGGAILELEVNYRNYSLSELARIVEDAEAKITLLSVIPLNTSNNVVVVFSINKDDATEVINALERHNYQVNSWFMNKGKIDAILDERYSAFMKYINV